MLIGLAVGGVGLWAMLSQQQVIIISDGDPELTKLPLSLIVAGIIVALLGVIGVVGGLFMRSITGRILIGVYAFVLVLLIINEIGAGVSAVVFQDQIRRVFVGSAKRSLMRYGSPNSTHLTDQWDRFQRKYSCCGADNYTSYRQVFNNNTVPASCCREDIVGEECDKDRMNVTARDPRNIYAKGCPDAVLGELKEYDLTAAILAIVFAAVQFTGVVLACAMAYMSSRTEGKEKYLYNRLIQEQT